MPVDEVTSDGIRTAYETAKAALLSEMVSEPVAADDPVQKLLDAPVSEMRHWVGELSTSALSTATAVMALEQMRRQYVAVGREVPEQWLALIRDGIEWLIAHQNTDGGWGDTVKSVSNISTTMLCHAVLCATRDLSFLPLPLGEGRGEGLETTDSRREENGDKLVEPDGLSSTSTVDRGPHPAFGHPLPKGEGIHSRVLSDAQAYIAKAGGVKAVVARYGKDRTFSVPILTHCALAGLVDWKEVISLPFELACIPAKFYAAVRLPVVSYALPALIAIGQVRFHFRPSKNPLRRWLQRWAKPASLKVLERIQPSNGGFLEATPLTSFVTMSLAAMGLHDHPVAQKGIEFILKSARHDVGWDQRSAGPPSSESGGPALEASLSHPTASWPIDTNLATWVTTLAINALEDDVPLDARPGLRAWLLRQQYRVVHPYTNAAPGGWAWTDLPGGVPDADDTPGAMLAVLEVSPNALKWWLNPASDEDDSDAEFARELLTVVDVFHGTYWLEGLQNGDGGWPTFCRGWGTLPFDRSAPDITAHALRAIHVHDSFKFTDRFGLTKRLHRMIERGVSFLQATQRPDGSWLPLWFGNQHAPNDENPTYGTAKVLAAFQAFGWMSDESAVRGVRWLVENQNPDGGWGAGPGTPSSVEETALALEALIGVCGADSCPLPLGEGGRRPGEGREAVDVPTQTGQQPVDVSGTSASQTTSTLDRIPHPSPLPEGEGTTAKTLAVQRGLSWLIPRVEDGRFREPTPIGFYFAKLWYFEALYPLIFTVAALRKAAAMCGNDTTDKPANDGK